VTDLTIKNYKLKSKFCFGILRINFMDRNWAIPLVGGKLKKIWKLMINAYQLMTIALCRTLYVRVGSKV
jgi:hypothetical protein|tara:strand:+ start:1272 stop:1478 length:207 start_codon:yes stop_codon:yes gene_type:complete